MTHESYFFTVAQVTPIVLLVVLIEDKIFVARSEARAEAESEVQAAKGKRKPGLWLEKLAVAGTGSLILCEILCIQALYANVDSAWTRIVVGMCLLFGGLLSVYTIVWRYVFSELESREDRQSLGRWIVVCSLLAIGVSIVLFWDQYQHSWWRL